MLQSPEGDWADCDGCAAAVRYVVYYETLQSPEGDWADCDKGRCAQGIAGRMGSGLQSPEGDWADCDESWA